MKEKILFNLNFDDFHPQKSKDMQDFGGDREKGLFKYVDKLIKKYPDVKVTMFTVPNWISLPDDRKPIKIIKHLLGMDYHHSWEGEPFRLDKHKDWCKWVNKYVKKGNLEICVHGLYHHNKNSWASSAEFEGLSYDESIDRILKAEEIMKKSKIKFVKGFRPPGWGMSDGMIKAVKDLKYDFVSLYGTPYKLKKVSTFKGLINIPQNYSILEKPEEGMRIAEETNLLMAKGHFAPKQGHIDIPNGLNKENFNNLVNLLKQLDKKYKIEFVSMNEIAKRYKKGKL